MPKNVNKKNDFDLDLTDQSFIDFKKSKSISITTKLSDIKESKIGELYDTKILHDKLNSLCIKKVSAKGIPITKKVSKDICECLFDKNKELSVSELENKVLTKHETPGSQCIQILDKALLKYKTNSKTKRKTKSKTKSKSKSKHK